jgi:hypothetical protein
MAKEISQLLKEATKDLLTPETLAQIQEAFDAAVNERVTINVESALVKQDAEYTEKLKHLLEAIDKDHTQKLERVVEAIDVNNTAKLQLVVNKYRNALNESAKEFKSTLVEKVSRFMDLYLEEKVPQDAVNEAVKNKKAALILNNLRESLAIDSALMNASLREAIMDGKNQITESSQTIQKLAKEVSVLKENLQKEQARFILEQKTANLSDKKKDYAKRVLADKSPEFIIENIDYTISLFDKKEEELVETLKEQAFNERTVTTDSIVEESVIEEQTKNLTSPEVGMYMSELGRY